MVVREKVELLPTIKPNLDEDNAEMTYVLSKGKTLEGVILSVKDIPTKFGSKILITLEIKEEDGINKYQVFANAMTLNNLIDAFGKEDINYVGKKVTLKNEKDKHYKKDCIVLYKSQ